MENIHDLIAGYAAYTDAAELGQEADQAPAVTPTITSSGICGGAITVSVTVSVYQTQDKGC